MHHSQSKINWLIFPRAPFYTATHPQGRLLPIDEGEEPGGANFVCPHQKLLSVRHRQWLLQFAILMGKSD